MAARIVEAALRVFAEKGPDAPVVDDFTRAAGISRGTFYNHFDSVPELLEATSVWTIEEAVASIERQLGGCDGPLVRFGTGLRLFLRRAQRDRPWCLFVAKTWRLGALAPPRSDLAEARRRALVRVPDVEIALEVVLGGVREAMLRIGSQPVPSDYAARVVEVCLQAVGAAPERIAAILRQPLPAWQSSGERP
jgi:AcrR family transcriptional regulator